MQSTERWLPVVGYEGCYEVSDKGRVRSIPRVVIRSNGSPQTIRGRYLKPASFNGYPVVGVRKSGQGRTRFVHRLVAEAFLGPGLPGQEVCHGDGSRTNNSVTNLRWGTRSDNMQDALRHGTHANAAKGSCVRGHEFTPENTRIFVRGGTEMRICIKCRKRKEACPVCGEMRSHYGMRSHLKHAHKID